MIKLIKETYLDLFLFLKKPVDQSQNDQTLKEKVARLFLILILDIAIASLCGLLISVLEKSGLISTENHKIIALLRRMNKSEVILAFVIVLPFLEEIIFRLYLRYRTNYLLRLFILLFYVTGKSNKERIEEHIKKIWFKKFFYIFYFSAVIFGFVHLFNFDFNYKLLLLFPILTAPQIFTGVFTGYLRIRYNLIWGYFLHAFHNLILFSPFLIAGDNIELLNRNTDDYNIKIEEALQSKSKSVGKFFRDSIYFQNYRLKDIIAFTSNKGPWLIESNDDKKINVALNLTYKNKLNSGSSDKKIIDEHLANLYGYKMERINRLVSVWNLTVNDSEMLMQYKTDSAKGNRFTFSNDSAVLYRGNLAGIAFAIQNSKQKNVFLKDNIKGRYNIKLSTTDSTDLKKKLISIYGLKLVDSVANVEYLNIEFSNKK